MAPRDDTEVLTILDTATLQVKASSLQSPGVSEYPAGCVQALVVISATPKSSPSSSRVLSHSSQPAPSVGGLSATLALPLPIE